MKPDTINWDHVSPEYTCMARDDLDTAYLYSTTPVLLHADGIWDCDGLGTYAPAKAFASYKRGDTDWRDSLVFRPGCAEGGQ
jgi:hypothetical protein